MKINTDYSPSIGLFGYVNGYDSAILNLKIVDPNIACERSPFVGSLIGTLNQGVVVNCTIVGGEILGKIYVGGLIGKTESGTIYNCHS